MKTSSSNSNHSRPASGRFGKIVSAAAFGLLIGAFAIGPVQAKDHGDRGRGRGHEERHEGGYRGRGYYRGPDYAYGNPYRNYYYAPGPDYYYEPEPYDYGYYPPEQGYYSGPSEGILQFFGF